MDIIDAQAMLGPVFPEGGYSLDTLESVRARYSKEHNLRFVVVPTWPTVNDELPSIIAANPRLLLGGYLVIAPRKDMVVPGLGKPIPYTSPDQVYVLAKQPAIKGLQVQTTIFDIGLDEPRLRHYVDICAEFSKPMMIHCGSDSREHLVREGKKQYTMHEQKMDFIAKYPHIKIIWEHMLGTMRGDDDEVKRNLELLAEHGNSYATTTGTCGQHRRFDIRLGKTIDLGVNLEFRKYWRDIINEAMTDRALQKKIIYGSDVPHLDFDLFPLDGLELRLREQMMQNAARLLRLDRKPSD